MNFLRLTLIALILAAVARAERDVTVVVDMTPEGRKLAHPTPAHPAYYLPVMRGYFEFGDRTAREKPPSAHDIVRIVAPELDKKGNRAIDDTHQKPDIVFDFAWGVIAPAGDDTTVNTQNENQRAALVLGN